MNVNVEAKEQGRDMQTPIDDFDIFTEVSRSTEAPSRVTPWIASGLPHTQVGL